MLLCEFLTVIPANFDIIYKFYEAKTKNSKKAWFSLEMAQNINPELTAASASLKQNDDTHVKADSHAVSKR